MCSDLKRNALSLRSFYLYKTGCILWRLNQNIPESKHQKLFAEGQNALNMALNVVLRFTNKSSIFGYSFVSPPMSIKDLRDQCQLTGTLTRPNSLVLLFVLQSVSFLFESSQTLTCSTSQLFHFLSAGSFSVIGFLSCNI